MYNIQTVSERIKLDARQQGIKLKEMLESCGLNVNFISQMSDRTGAFALAKIACNICLSNNWNDCCFYMTKKSLPGYQHRQGKN